MSVVAAAYLQRRCCLGLPYYRATPCTGGDPLDFWIAASDLPEADRGEIFKDDDAGIPCSAWVGCVWYLDPPSPLVDRDAASFETFDDCDTCDPPTPCDGCPVNQVDENGDPTGTQISAITLSGTYTRKVGGVTSTYNFTAPATLQFGEQCKWICEACVMLATGLFASFIVQFVPNPSFPFCGWVVRLDFEASAETESVRFSGTTPVGSYPDADVLITVGPSAGDEYHYTNLVIS